MKVYYNVPKNQENILKRL